MKREACPQDKLPSVIEKLSPSANVETSEPEPVAVEVVEADVREACP